MAMALPPNLARQIQQFVDRGNFADAEDVLEHARSLLAADQRFARIKAAIDASSAGIVAGRLLDSTPEFWQGIRVGSAVLLHTGEEIDRDVCPE